MREYGQIQIEFWSDPKVLRLSDQAKILMLYFVAGPHSNSLGCMRAPAGYIQDDLNWDRDTVSTRCNELEEHGLIHRDQTTGWTLLPRYLKHNPPHNNSVSQNIRKLFYKVPEDVEVYPQLVRALIEHGTKLEEGFVQELEGVLTRCAHRADTVSAREQDPEPEQDHDQEPEPERDAPTADPHQSSPRGETAQLPSAQSADGAPDSNPPQQQKHQGKEENVATWEAYAEAYRQRYGVDPIRNAKVNTQIANFVKRVGKENAPHVAAFYVHHNGQFYVARGHQVGIMLNDAEKLYTEWASGRQMTAKAARDADRQQEAGEGWTALLRGEEANG